MILFDKDKTASSTVGKGNTPVVNAIKDESKIYNIWDFNSSSQDEYQAQNKSAKEVSKDLAKSSMYYNRVDRDNAALVEQNLINNTKWKVDVVVNPDAVGEDLDGDGVISEKELTEAKCEAVSLLDAIVDSYDSALDLYIEKQVEDIIEKYGPNCTYNLRAMFGSPDSPAIQELAKLGIRADAVGDHDLWQNRTYTFSLVDMTGTEDMTDEELFAHVYADDAKILQDADGNKGSIIFADCLTADGTAQSAELNLSSILDQMGYDCVSKADFIGNEDKYYEMIEQIGTDLKNNQFTASDKSIDDIYGPTIKMYEAVCAVYTINGDAPGQWDLGRDFWQTKNAVDGLGDSLYHLSNSANIDLNGDGIISAEEIAYVKEHIEEFEGDEEEKVKTITLTTSTKNDSTQSASSAQNSEISYSELKDLNKEIKKMQEQNPELDIDEALKEYAKENGYVFKELKEQFDKEF